MLLDNQCIVAQLPPQMPRKRLMATTSGRSQARISNSRIRSVASAVSASMERSAPVATALKLSPSRASSRAAVSSIRFRSASSLPLNRDGKSFGLEVSLIQFSLQPPPLSAVRIAGGDVVLALAGHLQANILQRGDHVGAALDRAVLDALTADSRGSVCADPLRVRARPAASTPRCRPHRPAAAPWRVPGRSGRLQPCSWLKASRSGSKVRCQPGGAMFRLRPVCRSHCAARMCA